MTRPTALLIEDNPAILGMLTDLLLEIGYDVQPCRDVVTAMGHWKERADFGGFQLVVTDDDLPEREAVPGEVPRLNQRFACALARKFTDQDPKVQVVIHSGREPVHPEILGRERVCFVMKGELGGADRREFAIQLKALELLEGCKRERRIEAQRLQPLARGEHGRFAGGAA